MQAYKPGPRRVVKDDLPPTAVQVFTRAMKRGIRKTGEFVKTHRKGVLFGTLMTIGFVGGFILGNAVSPVRTNIQKFEAFSKKYSIKLSKAEFAKLCGDAYVQKWRVEGTPHYFLLGGMGPKNEEKFQEGLNKSKLDVQFGGTIKTNDINFDTTAQTQIFVLLEPKSFEDDGKPEPEKVTEDLSYFAPDRVFRETRNRPIFKVIEIAFSTDSTSGELGIIASNSRDRLSAIRFASDIRESGFDMSAEVRHEAGASRIMESGKAAVAPEYDEVEKVKLKGDSFLGRFGLWHMAFNTMLVGFWISWGISKWRKWW